MSAETVWEIRRRNGVLVGWFYTYRDAETYADQMQPRFGTLVLKRVALSEIPEEFAP